MLSLVHFIRENTEKLERHEIREHHLGDQVKRSLGILTKKITDIEEIRRHLERFDTRVTSIERSLDKVSYLPYENICCTFDLKNCGSRIFFYYITKFC